MLRFISKCYHISVICCKAGGTVLRFISKWYHISVICSKAGGVLDCLSGLVVQAPASSAGGCGLNYGQVFSVTFLSVCY